MKVHLFVPILLFVVALALAAIQRQLNFISHDRLKASDDIYYTGHSAQASDDVSPYSRVSGAVSVSADTNDDLHHEPFANRWQRRFSSLERR